ncbi:MAG: nucleoside deaminase [Candidatus Babeliales bacterium]
MIIFSTYDEQHMRRALKLAQKAFERKEVPVGALVVGPDGTIIGRGYNKVEKYHQQSYHAEVIALNQAGKKLGDWRLNGCTLYVTLEPCKMCMGLIQLSRISRVVYGARSKLFGYQLDKEGQSSLYKKDIDVQEGLLAEQSAYLLKNFFKQKRKNRD